MRTSTKIPKRKQPVPIRPKPISSIPHFSMAALKRLYSLILPQTGMNTLQPVLLPLPLPVKATPLYPFPEIRNLLSQPSPMKSSTYLEPSQTPAMYQCSPKCPTIPTNVSSFYDDTGVPATACPSFDVCLKTLTYDITTGFVVSEGPGATPQTTSPGATPKTTSPMKSSTYHEPSQTLAMYQCTLKCPTIPTNVSSFYDDTGVPATACPSFDVCLKTLTYDITTGFVVSEGPEATPKTTSPMKSSTYHEPSQTLAMYQCTLKCPTIPTNVSSFYDDTGVPAPACPSFDVCLKTLTYDITTGFVVSEGPEATPKTTSPMKSSTYHEPSQTLAMYQCTLKCPTIPTNVSSFYDDTGVPATACPSFDVCLKTLTYDITTGFVVSEGPEATPKTTSPMKSSTYNEPSQTPAMYQCTLKCPTIPTNVSSFYDDTGVPAPACPSFDVCLKTLTYDITTGFVVSEGPEATPKTTSPMKSSTYNEPSQTPAMYQCTLKCPTIPTNVSSFYDDTGVPAPACPSFDVCLKTLTYDITTGFVVSEGTEATPKTTSPEATLLELGPINELPAYVPVVAEPSGYCGPSAKRVTMCSEKFFLEQDKTTNKSKGLFKPYLM